MERCLAYVADKSVDVIRLFLYSYDVVFQYATSRHSSTGKCFGVALLVRSRVDGKKLVDTCIRRRLVVRANKSNVQYVKGGTRDAPCVI